MKKTTYIGIFLVILAVFIAVFGINEIRKGNVKDRVDLPELVNGLLPENKTVNGTRYAIPEEYIADFGVDVPEISNPTYVSVTEADAVIADGLGGVSIEVNGQWYFYPYQIMNWHQVVQTEIDGEQLTVTYDPLCHSGRVYSGTLMHANQVYNNNALLQQEDGSLVQQGTGIVVSGSNAREQLSVYDSELVLWSLWKDEHPDGLVLAAQDDEPRDYTRHPYGAYDDNDIIYFPFASEIGDFSSKWLIDSFTWNGETIGFFKDIEQGFGVYQFQLAGENFVAFYDMNAEITRVFKSGANESFVYNFDASQIESEDGAVWSPNGLALSGDRSGEQLERVSTQRSFYMCWSAQHSSESIAHAENIETVDGNEGINVDLTQ